MPVGVYEVDLDQNITYVNSRGLELYGYTQEDLQNGLKTFQMMRPEDFDKALKVRPNILNGEKKIGFEYTALRKDGSTFQVYTQTDSIMRNGKLVGLRGVALDITERKQIEKALHENEERFRELAELLSSCVYELDLDSNLNIIEYHAGTKRKTYFE